MTHSDSRFLDSLGVRLLLALSVTVAVVFSLYAVLCIRSTSEQLTGMIVADAGRTSSLIRRATHDGMLLNQLPEVQGVMMRIAQDPAVLNLRVYDKKGAVVLSAHPEEVGEAAKLEEAPCLGCHGPGAPETAVKTESSELLRNAEGAWVVRHLSVLENERSCSTAACHAHPENETLLGVLDVSMSMDPVAQAVASTRRRLAVTSVVFLLVLGSAAWLIVQRLVLGPALRLQRATERVAAGDLETRISVPGRHEIARLAGAFNDMTRDLAEARREIEEWSGQLEDKVRAKTEDLQRANVQVLHMEKMASLGRLAATVAHEINNPLGGILTYARLVQRELEDLELDPVLAEKLGRHLDVIQRECRRSGEIVRNLLLFARRGESEKVPVDLFEVIERSLLLVRHHLEIHEVEARVEREVDDATIQGDFGQLEQALVALLVNAIEAIEQSGDGEGIVTVRLAPGTRPGEVHLEVSDTGVGIPPEVQAHLFEPFYSTKNAESGVGLGLAIVYGIIRRHGGRIEVTSPSGSGPVGGTTFQISLPRSSSRGMTTSEDSTDA